MKYTTIAIALILAASGTAQWTVINLHPAGASESRALGAYGTQQVGFADVGGIRRASLWSGSAASWVDLHPAGATMSEALGVYNGQQVGYAKIAGVNSASLWSGTPGSFVNLHPAGAAISFVYAARAGQQGGYARYGSDNHAGVWSGSPASWTDWHDNSASNSAITAMDASQIVGWILTPSVYQRAALWTGPGSWIDLTPGGAQHSGAYGVSDGQQVGSSAFNGQDRACLWSGTAGSWVDLHPVVSGSGYSKAYGVFRAMQVGSAEVVGLSRASLWSGTAASWVDLHAFLPSGFTSSRAQGIWHNGDPIYIVGYGMNNVTGRNEALMWVSRSVAPTSYNMFRGSVFSGNLGSLQNSDDDRLVMRPGVTLGTSQPPIQIFLNATAPTASPNGFSFSLESSASFGNAQQKISLHNFITGLYEELDVRLAKTTDDTVTVTVRTNPSRFIEPGTLAIRALVSFRAVGPSLSFPWSGRIDKAWWNFPG